MKKWSVALMCSVILIFICAFFHAENTNASPIVINEVCSRNGLISMGDEHRGKDYIELYNTTDKTVSLEGWYLSDDGENSDRQPLPAINLRPHDFVVFYADGVDDGQYSLNFKISQDGETIFLSNPSKEIADQIYVPALEMDYAYARTVDGSGSWEMLSATPGITNQKADKLPQNTLKAPVLSHESGFYDEEFVLTMRAGIGQKIYYTTDGSLPTEDSILYEDGIVIRNISNQQNVINGEKRVVADWVDYPVQEELADKATVIRAIVVDKHNRVSDVITETYLVGLEKYKDRNVMSLVADPDVLLGAEGIFVTGTVYDQWYLNTEFSSDRLYDPPWNENDRITNYWNRGRAVEAFTNMQVFKNGTEYLEQSVGMRVKGNYVRMLPKKSLKLISRSAYSGSSLFDEKILGDYDSHAIYASSVPEKVYCMNLAEGRNIGFAETEEYDLFINGEYWYTAYIMEEYDETYLAEHFGVNPDNVLMIKDTSAAIGEEYYYIYEELLAYLRDDSISQEEKGLYLYQNVDVQNIIDWLCFNVYVGNTDLTYKRNAVFWRTVEPEDGPYGDCKWRWLVYDIDYAATKSGAPPEEDDLQEFKIIFDNRFYWGLRTVEPFRRQFVITAMDMINTNFRPENVVEVLGEWGLDITHCDSYFLKRPQYMIQSLINEFNLTGTVEDVSLTINDSEAGKIYINTTEADVSEGTWTGQYFTDYPVKITAVANSGYHFVGWNGSYEAKEADLEVPVVVGGISLTAVFEKE